LRQSSLVVQGSMHGGASQQPLTHELKPNSVQSPLVSQPPCGQIATQVSTSQVSSPVQQLVPQAVVSSGQPHVPLSQT
jgi:hypothetical protein